MFQVPLTTSSTCLTAADFWKAVLLYHNRPHLVNRKLIAVSQVFLYKILFTSSAIQHISELFTRSAILYEVRKLKHLTKEDVTESFIRDIVECYDKNVVLTKISIDDFKEEYNGKFISVRILMPRNQKCKKCIEVVILDKDRNTATFLAVSEYEDKTVSAPIFPYEIQLTTMSNLRINLASFEDADTSHAEWIADKLFPKLLKWSEITCEENQTTSLSLVPVDEYCSVYARLKNKYGENLTKEWPKKTSTNPQKYIHEDLAIASYLICLWRKYAEDEVKFVDCGCGNGLLVYILNQEGYSGYGVDVRRRPTWDIYPKETRLEISTVTTSSVFPDSTWIIGNHSDELTPWMPVISLRSSPQTNFFVLPCCPYDFSGQKYIRTNTSVSQYCDYLRYIQNICTRCGFDTKIDKLRIPSTKRTCLVGIRRKFSNEEFNTINSDVNKFINTRLTTDFKPRSGTEKVRNCTQLSQGLIQKLVFDCVNNLLSEQNLVRKINGEYWNKGGCLSLLDLSKMLAREDLKQLKKECGGLQTLLRNHRYLFEIKDDKVYLREPLQLDENTKRYKEKPCWFFKYHPNGCLYDTDKCAYEHLLT